MSGGSCTAGAKLDKVLTSNELDGAFMIRFLTKKEYVTNFKIHHNGKKM